MVHLGRVIGKFRLERKLGHGAMGDVYLGVHVELGSFVAVKVLNAAACAEPNGVARFLAEAKAVAAIDHDQIARVIDQDTLPDGTPYIVMEFVEGVTLRELLDERGALGLRLTVELMLDVLSALSVAHARGTVHRDLKPENIRVTKSGRAKILDFGIAKRLNDAPTPLTQQGMLVGTPYYMSPEQIAGGPLDGRSDLYAVGVILFECVTGKRPFEGSTVVALLNRHVNEAPISPRLARPELTLALESVILRALEKQAVFRFGTADELAIALRRTFDELPEDGPVVRRIRAPQDLATPSLEVPQGTSEDALGNTVRTPVTRRFRRPLPWVALVLVLGLAALLRPLPANRAEAPGANGVGVEEGRGEGPQAPPSMPQAETAKPSTAQPPAPTPLDSARGERRPPPDVPVPPAPTPLDSARDERKPPSPEPKPPTVRTPLDSARGERKLAKSTIESTPPPPAPEPEPQLKGVTLIETGKDRRSLPIEFDPRAFDPLAFLPRAHALAQEAMPDAVLTNFDVEGLFDGDRVDLTPSSRFEANYWFRSPAKSIVDPRLRDEDQDIPCLQYVVVSAKHIEVFTAESFHSCKEQPLPRIACPPSAVLRGKDTSKAMKLSWLSDGWYLDFGASAGSESVACP